MATSSVNITQRQQRSFYNTMDVQPFQSSQSISFEHHSSFLGFLKSAQSGQRLSCISDSFVVDMFCKRGEEFKHVFICFETAYMRYFSAFQSLIARKCKVIRNLSSQFFEISLFFHRKHFQLKVTLKKALQNQSFQF